MIKIESWFSDEMRTAYWKHMLLLLSKNIENTIEFLPGFTIDMQTLLTGTRKEVLNICGIKKYMSFCLFEIRQSNYTVKDYLKQLNQVFPQDIKIKEERDGLTYTLGENTVKVKHNISNQRCVEGNMDPFYEYYLDIIGVRPESGYPTFRNFLADAIEGANRVKKKVTDIIRYNLISGAMRHRILSSLHIKCCPYCNRQYITLWYDKDNKEHPTADLDHFYPKSIYPLFALSLFNFVPSCQICNLRMKGSKSREILYPYEEDMDEFSFLCESLNGTSESLVDLWLANKAQNPSKLLELYQLVLVDESNLDETDGEVKEHIDRIRRSIEMFHLEELYQTHLEVAINEMLKIRIYYSGDFSNCAKKTLTDIGIFKEENEKNEYDDFEGNKINNISSKSSFSEEEMRDIILGFVFEGQNKLDKPLGKLLNDILEHELQMKQLCNK